MQVWSIYTGSLKFQWTQCIDAKWLAFQEAIKEHVPPEERGESSDLGSLLFMIFKSIKT